MNKKLLIDDLATLLEVDAQTLTDEYQLMDSGLWDSLSMVSMVGSIDTHYGVAIQGHELEASNTVGEIFSLIASKANKVNSNVVNIR